MFFPCEVCQLRCFLILSRLRCPFLECTLQRSSNLIWHESAAGSAWLQGGESTWSQMGRTGGDVFGIWGPLIWAKLHPLPVQESGRLDQVGTVVAFGHPECPAGLCKVTIVAAIEWDLPPKPGNLGRQKWRVPCPGEKLPLWTSRQIWADHTWLGPHWHFSSRN